QDPEFSNADQMDLYDDVLAASSQPQEKRSSSSEAPPEIRQEPSPKPNSKPPAILYTYSGLRNKRAAVYVGSFSWWTTDQQLIQTIRSVGVYDVVELKFAENRANGQSKGYAEVVVASENSVHKLLELLPGKILNGDKVEVRLATRQNLSQFEAQARKRIVLAGACPRRSWPALVVVAPLACFVQGNPPRPFPAELLRSLPLAPVPEGIGCLVLRLCPDLPWSFGGAGSVLWAEFRLPPGHSGVPVQPLAPLGAVAPVTPLLRSRRPGRPPAAPHSSFPVPLPAPAALGPPPDTYGKAMAPYNHSSRELGPPIPAVSEGEFEEIMNRNRAISSSAISKAVSGASAGDYSNAIETLLTAIAVIKQSRVASDERCRVLLSSLKDCLHGIEAKSYSSSSSSSSRKRHRSRERSPSRSRESSRRHRDLLHSDDRHEDYFQERSREHERHRDRDRDRDR
ncbi:Cleavage and polyadenylation specificity factor subunit 7, partial [Corvus brachyrhynchos]